jgi:hypothetical protein
MLNSRKSVVIQGALTVAAAVALSLGTVRPAQAQSSSSFSFAAGDLVVSVEGDGSGTGSYADNQAAPLTLYQYSLTGTSIRPKAAANITSTSSARSARPAIRRPPR